MLECYSNWTVSGGVIEYHHSSLISLKTQVIEPWWLTAYVLGLEKNSFRTNQVDKKGSFVVIHSKDST